VIDWTSHVLTADAYPFFVAYWFPGMPWEVPEHYFRRSPLALVGNVKTPTMLLTGEQDWRTPISQAEEYYQALKLRGIETALVRIPDSSHALADRPSQLIAKVLHILEWFERYGGAAAAAKD
jgi:acylaminoacyl-peptidase